MVLGANNGIDGTWLVRLPPPVGLAPSRALDREHWVTRDSVPLIRPAKEALENRYVLRAGTASRRSPGRLDELLHALDANRRCEVR
jgi:hypothetical protein